MADHTTYSVAQLLPHQGPAVLLDEILAVDEQTLEARLRVRCDSPLVAPGADSVPGWMGMEYMAQAIAAWAGFHALEAGRSVKPGFLVGSRRFQTSNERLARDLWLTVAVERVFHDSEGIGVFECRVSGEGVSQQAMLKVFLPDDVEQYLKDSDDE